MDQSGNSQSYIEMCLHTHKKAKCTKKTTFNPSPRSKIQPYTYEDQTIAPMCGSHQKIVT